MQNDIRCQYPDFVIRYRSHVYCMSRLMNSPSIDSDDDLVVLDHITLDLAFNFWSMNPILQDEHDIRIEQV